MDFSESGKKQPSHFIWDRFDRLENRSETRHFRQSTHRDKPVLEEALDRATDICPEKSATTDPMLDRQGSSSASFLQGKPKYCRKKEKKMKSKRENSEKACRV